MTDHLAEARAAIHAEHGWSMAAPASSLADMAYAIARILDHLEAQQTDEPEPEPDQAYGDADESTKPKLNVQTESWTAIYGGGEIVSSAGFSHWLDNIRAEAWDEGFVVGATHGIAYQAGDDNALPQPSALNPYRQEQP